MVPRLASTATQTTDIPNAPIVPEPAEGQAHLQREAREARFLIEDDALAADLIAALRSRDVGSVPASVSTMVVVDSYWDTADWSLFSAGWTYRARDVSGKKSLTLESVESARRSLRQKQKELERQTEILSEQTPDPSTAGPMADPLDSLRSGVLRELFRVHSCRRLFSIRIPEGGLIEVAIDQATITTSAPPSKVAPGRLAFLEIQMELTAGREESFERLAATLERRFRLLPSRLGRLDRGLQAAGLSPPRPPRPRSCKATPFLRNLCGRELSPTDSAMELAYRCLLEHFEEMLAAEPKAWEGLEPEGVHKMRVCTRRLRAALRAFKRVLPAGSIGSFNRGFGWLAAALGEVRDLDVSRENLERYTAEIPATDAAHLGHYQRHLEDQWSMARERLLTALSSRRYLRLKSRFARFLERGPSQRALAVSGGVTIGDAAPRLMRKYYKDIRREGRAVTSESPDELLHALRIQCKRQRYLFEFFHRVYGNAFKQEIRLLKELQGVLGAFQNACVADRQVRRYAEGVSTRTARQDLLVALERLSSSQRRQAELSRAEVGQVWARFDSNDRQESILAPLGETRAMSAKTSGRSARGAKNSR